MPRVNVRLTDETHTAIQNEATRKGCDLSTEIRMVLRAHYQGAGVLAPAEPKAPAKGGDSARP